MAPEKRTWTFLWVSITVLLAVSMPYLAAGRAGGEDYVFGGLLQNPLDGNSYLAKMYQGWLGEWTFTLPYTDQPGEGAYLFLFYLFLGHLARISGLSILLVFHIARLACTAFMLLALWRFFGATFHMEDVRVLAFVMACLGSGLGWLAALAGVFTADFWVAEAYPFLAAYANPHFPLGLGLMLLLLAPVEQKRHTGRRFAQAWIWLTGLALGLVMPFGVIVVIVILAGEVILGKASKPGLKTAVDPLLGIPAGDEAARIVKLTSRFQGRLERHQSLFGLLVFGTPVLVYDYWVATTHPVLSGWNAQNLTPAPLPWDIFLSLSPALWLAFAGGLAAWRSGLHGARLLLTWAGLGLVLLYLPFDLQRRFIVGLYVPLAGLAALGIVHLARGIRWRRIVLVGAFFLLAMPTNGMILLFAVQGIANHTAPLYLDMGQHQALEWVQANTAQDAVVLAAPETSLWIPSHTGRRVVAGHPFETVSAVERILQVEAVFRGTPEPKSPSWLASVDYVWIGPHEQSLGGKLPDGNWQNVYEQGGVWIWSRTP